MEETQKYLLHVTKDHFRTAKSIRIMFLFVKCFIRVAYFMYEKRHEGRN